MRRSLAVVVAGVLLTLGAQTSLAGPSLRLAILPIAVHTLEQKEYLEAGLADMLASRLGRVAGVAVIRVQGEGLATSDIDAAKRSGREAGAEYVLFGSFTQFGEGASLDLRCAPVSAEVKEDPQSIFIQSGSLDEIIPNLDQVAERVGRRLSGGGAATVASSGSLPSVSAAAPGDAGASSSVLLRDALSELEELRNRVEAIEQRVFSPAVPSRSADEPGGGAAVPGSDTESESELR
jgi:TolB-like protein